MRGLWPPGARGMRVMTGVAQRTCRRYRVLAAALVCAALGSGCQTVQSLRESYKNFHFSSNYEDPLAETKMAEAERLFADGYHAKAMPIFKELADNTGNNAILAERARFLQAECRRLQGQYPEAVDTYHRLLMDFQTGIHRQEACSRMFEIADYWLDNFRDELIARSTKGEQGIFHWHPSWPNPWDRTRPTFVEESRATEALELVHTYDILGPKADKALFWCGYVNYIRGNFIEADHFFSQLIELHKDSPLRPQAITYAIQAKNNATGGAVYDGRKCAEALHLIYVAEASVPELTRDPEMADQLTRAKFAIRYQQAEKDFRTAEYYERTGHPGSAVFYYELVKRRYTGTQYADIAVARQQALRQMMADGHPPKGHDPWVIIQAKWKEVFTEKGNAVVPAGGPMKPAGPGQGSQDQQVIPAGGAMAPISGPMVPGSPIGPQPRP